MGDVLARILLGIALGCLMVGPVWAGQRVQVTDPYLEWRRGPATAYPVFHVSERGEWVSLTERRTRWVRVADDRGREGWVRLGDLGTVRDEQGQPLVFREPDRDDYQNRRWEAGLGFGQFDQTSLQALSLSYWPGANIVTELRAAQALGSAAETRQLTLGVAQQLFGHRRLSPYLGLGGGQIWVSPRATLSAPDRRSDTIAFAQGGLRYYLGDRYMLRGEARRTTIFTNRQNNEDVTEWTLGFSVFF